MDFPLLPQAWIEQTLRDIQSKHNQQYYQDAVHSKT